MDQKHGQCLCGKVAYSIKGPFRNLTQCHCAQCRQWGGHYWASLSFNLKDFAFERGEDEVKWYESSDYARRGFCGCGTCGSSLFWHADRAENWKHTMAVSAGSLTEPTGMTLGNHIFCAHKGDYYEIKDGLPQYDEGD